MAAIGPDKLLRIAGTRAVDAQGRPLVLHHGTDAEFESFAAGNDLGIHFGSRAQARKRIEDLSMPRERKSRRPGTRNRVVSALLKVTNPLLVPDDPVAWPSSWLRQLFRRFIPDAEMPLLAKLAGPTGSPGEKAALAAIKKRLVAAGHDGILYRNMIESPTRARAVDWSWCVFDPKDIVIVGEDVAVDHLEVPPDIPAAFGGSAIPADPADIPGLRRRNGNFVRKACARRFEAACASHLAGLGAVEIEPGYQSRQFRLDLPDDTTVKAEIQADLGRLRFWPSHPDVLRALRVVDDGGRAEYAAVFEWQPGEEISDTLARAERSWTSWLEQTAPRAMPAPAL